MMAGVTADAGVTEQPPASSAGAQAAGDPAVGDPAAGTTARTVHRAAAPGHRIAGLLAAVPAGGLAGLAFLGQSHHWGVTPLAAGMFALQLVLALAWLAALDAPGSLGAFLLGAGAAGTADAVIAAYPRQGLHVIAAVAGVGIVLSLVQQLVRRPRPHVVVALGATTSLIVLELAGSSVLALRAVIARPGSAIAAGLFGVAAALLGARLVDFALHRPRATPASSRGVPGLLVGIAAAGGVGALWADHFRLAVPGDWIGARIGIVAAVLALVGDLTVDVAGAVDLDERPRSALAPLTLVLPTILAGPVIYVAARYLLG